MWKYTEPRGRVFNSPVSYSNLVPDTCYLIEVFRGLSQFLHTDAVIVLQATTFSFHVFAIPHSPVILSFDAT
jgi:hypothetical protein